MSFQGFAKASLKTVSEGKNGPKIKVSGQVFSDAFNKQITESVGKLIEDYRAANAGTKLTDEQIAKQLFDYKNVKTGKTSYGVSVELEHSQDILGVPVKFGRGLWVSLPLA